MSFRTYVRRFFLPVLRPGDIVILDTGEELRDENAAWQETKRLTRDIEDSLEMNGHWNVEVCDADGPLYSIKIASQKLR